MKINGWDISEAQAEQSRVVFGKHVVENRSEWTRASPVPVFMDNTIGFQGLKIDLLIRGKGREDIIKKRSQILSRLLKTADIELDDYKNRYKGILRKHSTNETDIIRWHVLTLEFDAYEYAAQADGSPYSESASGSLQTVVTNPGNILTPAIVEIIPQIGTAQLTVTGICRDPNTGTDLPVTIRNLTTGKKVILDGETGLMTEDGALKAADIDIWEVPSLLPGSNTITMDSSRMDITVKYYPRFM